jgi:flagellar biosynthesis protein FlhG
MFGHMPDQASGLRRLLGQAPLHAVALAGAGATTLALNLAAAIGAAGLDVVLVDESAGNGNLADQLGITTRHELLHVLNSERSLQEVMCDAGRGVRLLPAARGARELAQGDDACCFAACLREAPPAPDLVLIDSVGGKVSRLLADGETRHETVIVTGASHDAITSAYALVKSAVRESGETRFRVIVNRVRSQAEATAIFRNMSEVARRHAGADLEYLGWLPHDPQLRYARKAARSAVDMFPTGVTALAARSLAQRLREGHCGRGEVACAGTDFQHYPPQPNAAPAF